jgi:hypothetical protein
MQEVSSSFTSCLSYVFSYAMNFTIIGLVLFLCMRSGTQILAKIQTLFVITGIFVYIGYSTGVVKFILLLSSGSFWWNLFSVLYWLFIWSNMTKNYLLTLWVDSKATVYNRLTVTFVNVYCSNIVSYLCIRCLKRERRKHSVTGVSDLCSNTVSYDILLHENV